MEIKKITLVKLGGALITNKDKTPDEDPVLIEFAMEQISQLLRAHHGPLILAHGNGSFGHPVAAKHVQRIGSRHWDDEAAREIRFATRQLNTLVQSRLSELMDLEPFYTEDEVFRDRTGVQLGQLPTRLLEALGNGKTPLLYGALINKPGGYEVISTETLLVEIAKQWPERVSKAWFLSKDPGIDSGSFMIESATLNQLPELQARFLRSLPAGVLDVSGGMKNKLAMAGELAKLGVPTYIGQPFNVGEPARTHKSPGTWVLP